MQTGGQSSTRPDADADGPREHETTRAEPVEIDDAGIATGHKLGRYWLLEQLGRGGMGVVYLGYDSELHRKVAVKLLHNEPGGDIREPRRLLREAQALAQVSHPNLVRVYDVGEVEGRVFMAMELVEGRPVSKWFKDRPGWRRVLDVMLAAGRGLQAAHAAGIVHRDFKPANVIVADDGAVRVLDFGLARVDAGAEDPSVRNSNPSLDTHSLPPGLTAELADESNEPLTVGVVLGTPAYMAPEQHVGITADALSDQYSFCIALYEGLYGQRPFPKVAVPKLARLKRAAEFRDPPDGVRVPKWLRRAVLKGLSPDPGERYPSMDALLARLVVTPVSTKVRRAGLAMAAGLLAFSGWAVGRRDTPAEAKCDAVADAIGQVWSPQRATTIAEAFAATDLSYAADTWQRLTPTVDAYAEGWKRMRTEACRATHVEGTQSGALLDLKMACLDRRQSELDAVLTLYETPDAALVQRAADAIGGLPSLQPCGDAQALTAAVPRPESAADREAVAAAQRWMAEADALGAAGRHTAAERRARAALAEGERLAYRPLVAEAQLALAAALANDPEGAEQAGRAAVELAAEVGDDRVLRDALRRLIYEIGVRRGRHPEAQGIALAARAAWLRSGLDPKTDASLQSNLGLLAAARGNTAEARAHFEASLSALDAEGASTARRLVTIGGYGAALMQQGAWAESTAVFEEAKRLGIEAYGPRHPYVADVDLNLGQVTAQTGDAEAANRHFEAALAVLEAAPDQHAERLALSYCAYAAVALVEGRPAAARARARRALTHLEPVDDEGPLAAAAYDVLGTAASFERRDAEAVVEHRRGLAYATAGYGSSSPNEAVARAHLAESLALAGEVEEARRELATATKTIEAVFGRETEAYGETLVTLGELELAAGRPAAAEVALDAALRMMPEGLLVPVANAHFRRARARARLGRRQEAKRDAAKARASLQGLGLTASVARIDAWVAEAGL